MADVTLFDNDAVLKLSAFQCWEALSVTQLYPPAILAVARWSLTSQINKARRISEADAFRMTATHFISSCTIIEPSEEEIELATSIEEQATVRGGELDSGESLLVAVLVMRNLPQMVTGDKRAIAALAGLTIDGLSSRFYCLEQVLQLLVRSGDWQQIRASVCSERQMDTALAMIFACFSEPTLEILLDGFRSYIENLRATAPDLLVD